MDQLIDIFGFYGPTYHSLAIRATKILLRSILLLNLLYLGGCDRGKVAPAKPIALQSEMLRRGLPGEPRTLDPQLADDTYSLQVDRDLFEGLTSIDRDGSAIPGLASEWTVDDTGRQYTFALRADARWSNGEPILADAFVEGMRRSVNPETGAGSSALLTVIRNASEIIAGHKDPSELGVTALGPHTLRIDLERPAPFILQILAEPISTPVRRTSDGKYAPTATITDGPYILGKRVPGAFLDLVRNANYWNAANVRIEKVRYINVESESTELKEFQSGQLDLTYTVPAPDLPRIIRSLGSEVQTSPILGTLYLALNLSKPAFSDSQELRQALSMAIDRDAIATNLSLGVIPAYAFVAQGISNYQPPTYSWSKLPREEQLRLAKALYKKAGYTAQKPLRLNLYFNNGEGIRNIMTAIAGAWRESLGVETSLVSDEFRVFLQERKDKTKWDVARLGWWADYNDPTSFLEIFATGNQSNDSGFSNKEFDRLTHEIRLDANAETRRELMERSESLMLNAYPIIPIYFYAAARLVKPNVGGAKISPLNRTYSKDLFWMSDTKPN